MLYSQVVWICFLAVTFYGLLPLDLPPLAHLHGLLGFPILLGLFFFPIAILIALVKSDLTPHQKVSILTLQGVLTWLNFLAFLPGFC